MISDNNISLFFKTMLKNNNKNPLRLNLNDPLNITDLLSKVKPLILDPEIKMFKTILNIYIQNLKFEKKNIKKMISNLEKLKEKLSFIKNKFDYEYNDLKLNHLSLVKETINKSNDYKNLTIDLNFCKLSDDNLKKKIIKSIGNLNEKIIPELFEKYYNFDRHLLTSLEIFKQCNEEESKTLECYSCKKTLKFINDDIATSPEFKFDGFFSLSNFDCTKDHNINLDFNCWLKFLNMKLKRCLICGDKIAKHKIELNAIEFNLRYDY